MTKTLLLVLIIITCLSGQTNAVDKIHMTVVAGGVYVGNVQKQVLSIPVFDENNQLDPTTINFKTDRSLNWSTGLNLGLVFWVKNIDKNSTNDDKSIGLGFGGHFIFTKSGESETIAPGIAVHFGQRKGLQLFFGVHFRAGEKVEFPNGKDSFLVPEGTKPSDFTYEGAGSHFGNLFVGLSTEI